MIDRRDSEDNVADLPTVNRFAVMLVPNEAFLHWAQSCFEDESELTLEAVRQEPTVYLIPEGGEEPERYLPKHYETMLVQELGGWCTDEESWPDDLSFRTFRSFFEVQVTSMVFDLGTEPLEIDA